MHLLPRRTVAATLTVGLALAGQWLGPAAASAPPAGGPVRILHDSDMDFDDASTLALLRAEHKLGRIDLRAVTVADNGFGAPHRALTRARSVPDRCGLPRMPVADGATGAGVHPAPPELVATGTSSTRPTVAADPIPVPGTAAVRQGP
ncbi:hypothetical protein ABGB07_25365 [Micromonosporaceae bacterium B7E4]